MATRTVLLCVVLALLVCVGSSVVSGDRIVTVQKGAKATAHGARVQVALATHEDGDDDHDDEGDGDEASEEEEGDEDDEVTETDEHNEEAEGADHESDDEDDLHGEHNNGETDSPGEDDDDDHNTDDDDEPVDPHRDAETTDHPDFADEDDAPDENDDAQTADAKDERDEAQQEVEDDKSKKEQEETDKYDQGEDDHHASDGNLGGDEDSNTDKRLDREPRDARKAEAEAEDNERGEGGDDEEGGQEESEGSSEEKDEENASSSESSSAQASKTSTPVKATPQFANPVGNVTKSTSANVTTISGYCRVCRALVLGAIASPNAAPGQPAKACAYATPEMMPACTKWRELNEPLIGPAVDGNKLCTAMGFCTKAELDQIAKNDAALAKAKGEKMMSESGYVRFDYNDDKVAPIYTGTGVRRVFQRVEFTNAFDHQPFVHVGLSESDVSNAADVRFKLIAKNVDRYGFDVELWTWKDTRIRTMGVTWFAYSRSLALNGLVRSGRIKTRNPKASFNKRVWFPQEFKNGYPVVSVSVLGLDASTGRAVSFNVEPVDVDRHGFLAQVKIDPLSMIRWTSFSWVAAVPSNVTGLYSGRLQLDALTTPGMARFWNPPLGPRSYEMRVNFEDERFDRCEQTYPVKSKSPAAVVHALIEASEQIRHPRTELALESDVLVETLEHVKAPIPEGYPYPKGLYTLGAHQKCGPGLKKVGETLITMSTGNTACSDIAGGKAHPSGCLYSICAATKDGGKVPKDSLLIGSFGSCPAPMKVTHPATLYTDGDSTCDKIMGKKAGVAPKGTKCENPICQLPLNDNVPRQAFTFAGMVNGCPGEFKPMGEILLGVKSITQCQELGGGNMGPDNVAKEREACKLMICQDSRPGATRLGPETIAFGYASKIFVPVAKPGDKVAFLIHDQVGCDGATKHALEVDKDRRVTIPANLSMEKWKICLGPAEATKDKQYVSRDDLQLTVVRRDVDSVKSFLIPMPVDITTKVKINGGAVAKGDLVAFINSKAVGCPKAATVSNPVDEQYDVSLRLPMGTYKVCFAKLKANVKDSDFVEQGGVFLNVGHNGVKADGPWTPLRETDLHSAVLNDRPMAYWELKEEKGSTLAKDAGNYNRHAVMSGTVGFGTEQITRLHSCGTFKNGYLSVTGKGVNAIPEITNLMSIEAWVHPISIDGDHERVIVERWEDGENEDEAFGYRLFMSGNKVVFLVQDGKKKYEVATGKIRSKRANYVVGVLSSESISIYLNGIIAKTVKHPDFDVGEVESNLRIGGVPGRAELNFVGSMSDIALYKSVLSAERIRIHYDFGKTSKMRVSDACIPVRPPLYRTPPQVSVEVTGFDVVEMKPIRIQAQATKIDTKGFTLRLHTWDDTRIKKMSVDFRTSIKAVPRTVEVDEEQVTDFDEDNSKRNPAKSCLELFEHDDELKNDVYWIRLKSGKIVRAMCDMEAGGWTRVMNIVHDSYSHANEVAELDPYAVYDSNKAAKFSDKDINAISTTDYFEFRCGKYAGFLKNRRRQWTSLLKNNEDWETAPDMDKFYCRANLEDYGFGDEDPDGDERCHTGFVRYAAASKKEGLGCYHDGEGWGQNGALWVR